MGIFSRFFGKKTESKQMDKSIVPNPDIENAVSLSIVFSGELNINNDMKYRSDNLKKICVF